MKKINIEKDLVEYDGAWYKTDKDGMCDVFTMTDLRQILKQQKEEFKKGLKKIQELADKEQCLETDLALQGLMEKL